MCFPQGSILGPLFTHYMNDFTEYLDTLVEVCVVVDDGTMQAVDSDIKVIEEIQIILLKL